MEPRLCISALVFQQYLLAFSNFFLLDKLTVVPASCHQLRKQPAEKRRRTPKLPWNWTKQPRNPRRSTPLKCIKRQSHEIIFLYIF